MSRLKTLLLTPVVALLLLSATQARAAQITYNYNWTPGLPSISGDKGGAISFTNEPPNTAIGSSDISTTNLRTISFADPTSPEKLSGSGAYKLTLQLTDADAVAHGLSNPSGTLVFTGQLGGTFSASNSNVTNKFTGMLTQQLFLGNNVYTVTIGPYTPPGPPNASNAGSISSHIDVQPAAIITKNVPEPSTMALSLFGLTSLGAGWWRKRRAAVAA